MIIKRIYNYIAYKYTTARRKRQFGALREKYGFDEWHMTPKWCKPYIKDVIAYIKNNVNPREGYIVDLGCGLCDILADGSLDPYMRMGFDLSSEVCAADAELYRDFEVKNGSFDAINDMEISCLIALNFTHGISEEDMASYFEGVLSRNKVQRIILDEVTGNYTYTHDFERLLPDYSVVKTLSGYASDGGDRVIKVFAKR